MTEISRDLIDDCVHCGFCLPTCPTYGPLWQEEMDSPRGRIYLMGGLVDGTIQLTDTTVEHFDRCLGCMACVTSCPSGVQYGTADRGDARARRAELTGRRSASGSSAGSSSRPCRTRGGCATALALTPPRLPGRLAPFAALKPPWRSAEQPPELTPAGGGEADARRAAARLRPAGRLRERERRDRARARRRGLRGRRAARPGVLRRAAPPRRPGRGGPPSRRADRRGLRRASTRSSSTRPAAART